MLNGLFQSKEQRAEKNAEKEVFEQGKEKIIVTTTDTIPQPFEIIGIASSNLYDAQMDLDKFIDELKGAALKQQGDAVIGLTFQTVGHPTEYTSLRNANKYDNHYHIYSGVKSRAIGTIVRFIKE